MRDTQKQRGWTRKASAEEQSALTSRPLGQLAEAGAAATRKEVFASHALQHLLRTVAPPDAPRRQEDERSRRRDSGHDTANI